MVLQFRTSFPQFVLHSCLNRMHMPAAEALDNRVHNRKCALRILPPEPVFQTLRVVADFEMSVPGKFPDKSVALLLKIRKAGAKNHRVAEGWGVQKQIAIGAEIARMNPGAQLEPEGKIAARLRRPGEKPRKKVNRHPWRGLSGTAGRHIDFGEEVIRPQTHFRRQCDGAIKRRRPGELLPAIRSGLP